MRDLKVGQVLWLKLRFNNDGDISAVEHPYLVAGITASGVQTVEVGQLDSLKPYKLLYKANKPIYADHPQETVLYKDSYIQLDNKIIIEYFDDLSAYRRTRDMLSGAKLTAVLTAYREYHANNIISPNKAVYITETELKSYN